MAYAFGVDGGASKSRAVLISENGQVVHLAKGPGVNYHEIGASKVSGTIARLYQECVEGARARSEECRSVCLGLAGVGRNADREILKPLFDEQFGKECYLLTSDADISLLSGSLSDSGIIVLGGTGSMLFGRNESQREARIGGHGPLLSDGGSGYRIALQALRAITAAHDGIGFKTSLQDVILEYLKLKSIEELVSWIYTPTATRERIASIASIVIQAADNEDPIADAILNDEADSLAIGVETLHKKLGLSSGVDVVLSGGLFSGASCYNRILKQKIRYLLPGVNVIPPKLDPVLGAGLYAMNQMGVAIDNDVIDTIRNSYREFLKTQSYPAIVLEEDSAEK